MREARIQENTQRTKRGVKGVASVGYGRNTRTQKNAQKRKKKGLLHLNKCKTKASREQM
jgi:hypothetical protein